MKCLHIINNIDSRLGGQVYALLNIMLMEKRLGYESSVLTTNSKNIDPLFLENFKVYEHSYSFPNRFYNSKGSIKFLQKTILEFDLIVIHGVWSIFLYRAVKVAYENKINIIMWPHGSLDPFDLEKKYFAKKLLGPLFIRSMIEKLNFIVCTSKKEKSILETYGIEKQVKVCPLPVVTPEFTGSKTRFRKKHGLGNNDFVFLFLSRIDYKKGLEILIPVFKNICSKYDSKLIIAGRGDAHYEGKVVEWIAQNNSSDNVRLVCYLSDQDKADAFSGSDCFVLPSLNENFGIAIFEALLSNCPVIISDNVYLYDTIIKKQGGWQCDYSQESLERVMIHVISNKEDYRDKKNHAHDAGNSFSPKNIVSRYKQLYKPIINSR